MSLTTFPFFMFILLGTIIYYLVPQKFRWLILLALSCYFYVSSGLISLIYILVSIITVWFAALLIDKITVNTSAKIKSIRDTISKEEKKAIKHKAKVQKKWTVATAIIINVGILFVVKYYNVILDGTSSLFGNDVSGFRLSSLIVPLGISFYSFQSIGYLLDVYGDKYKPEKNLARYALFISFFPQLIQGPIGRFDHMKEEFEKEKSLDFDSIKCALILMLWGYFKKLVIANRLAPLVDNMFNNPGQNPGWMAIVGVLAYSIQQYCDFSGGIDIITGVAELFGINLAKNFKRPYFSKSLAEFWRRWHISLGTWMRDYIFYPMAMSNTMNKISKFCAEKINKRAYVIVQMVICNITVFLIVGFWHGAQMHYIIWGLYNGVVIALGSIMEPYIKKWRDKHGITEKTTWFIIVSILWTFMLVNIGWFFDRSATVADSFKMIKSIFVNFGLSDFSISSLSGWGLNIKDYFKVAYGVILLFAVSLIEEVKGISVRESIVKSKKLIQWPILYILIFTLIAFATNPEGAEAFMYAQF